MHESAPLEKVSDIPLDSFPLLFDSHLRDCFCTRKDVVLGVNYNMSSLLQLAMESRAVLPYLEGDVNAQCVWAPEMLTHQGMHSFLVSGIITCDVQIRFTNARGS